MDGAGINFDPYGDPVDEGTLLEMVQEDFSAFNVLVTADRPTDGDYTMVVVSPTNFVASSVLGISSGNDCGNANPNNVSFAFFGSDSVYALELQATMISAQVGITVGLERTIDESQLDIMHQFVDGEDRSFIDLCIELRDPPAPACIAYHEAVCGRGSARQNAVQELLALLGPS